MKQGILRIVLIISLLAVSFLPAWGNEYALLNTNLGTIKVELDREHAPISVANFQRYAEQGFYNGTLFHRVMPGFVVQGGGYDEQLQRKQTADPIKNEADNGLLNQRGTIAMARTSVVDSATSQFFINLKSNPTLNHRGRNPGDYGYAVFGRVVEGMEVVDRIAAQPTTRKGFEFQNLPVNPVVLQRVELVTEEAPAEPVAPQ